MVHNKITNREDKHLNQKQKVCEITWKRNIRK